MPQLTCQHTDEHATEVDAHLGEGGGEGRGGEGRRGEEGRRSKGGKGGEAMTRHAYGITSYICRYVCTANNTVRIIISSKPVSGEGADRPIDSLLSNVQ